MFTRFAKLGDEKQAEQAIEKAVEQRKSFGQFHHRAYHIASAYALMNKPQQAIYWFKQAVEDGFSCYPLFEKDASLANLRGIREFEALLAKEKAKFESYNAKFGKARPPIDQK